MSQKFDNNVLDLVKQKEFYSYVHRGNFKSLKGNCKEKFYSSLTDKKVSDKEYNHVLKVWNKFKMKTMKDYHNLYLKYDFLLLADVFKILEIIA